MKIKNNLLQASIIGIVSIITAFSVFNNIYVSYAETEDSDSVKVDDIVLHNISGTEEHLLDSFPNQYKIVISGRYNCGNTLNVLAQAKDMIKKDEFSNTQILVLDIDDDNDFIQTFKDEEETQIHYYSAAETSNTKSYLNWSYKYLKYFVPETETSFMLPVTSIIDTDNNIVNTASGRIDLEEFVAPYIEQDSSKDNEEEDNKNTDNENVSDNKNEDNQNKNMSPDDENSNKDEENTNKDDENLNKNTSDSENENSSNPDDNTGDDNNNDNKNTNVDEENENKNTDSENSDSENKNSNENKDNPTNSNVNSNSNANSDSNTNANVNNNNNSNKNTTQNQNTNQNSNKNTNTNNNVANKNTNTENTDNMKPSNALPFSDIKGDEWYVDAVQWSYTNKLMMGYSGTTLFGPVDNLTRAQTATILWRWFEKEASGSYNNDVKNTTPFADNYDNQYYTAAINWAYEQKLFNGYEGTNIVGIDDPMTRQQICTVIYRASTLLNNASASYSSIRFNTFPDKKEVAEYAKVGVSWCLSKSVINGWNGELIAPNMVVDRAQMAQVVKNAIENGVLK